MEFGLSQFATAAETQDTDFQRFEALTESSIGPSINEVRRELSQQSYTATVERTVELAAGVPMGLTASPDTVGGISRSVILKRDSGLMRPFLRLRFND